jgi:hypothetical protein
MQRANHEDGRTCTTCKCQPPHTFVVSSQCIQTARERHAPQNSRHFIRCPTEVRLLWCQCCRRASAEESSKLHSGLRLRALPRCRLARRICASVRVSRISRDANPIGSRWLTTSQQNLTNNQYLWNVTQKNTCQNYEARTEEKPCFRDTSGSIPLMPLVVVMVLPSEPII